MRDGLGLLAFGLLRSNARLASASISKHKFLGLSFKDVDYFTTAFMGNAYWDRMFGQDVDVYVTRRTTKR